MQKTIKLESGKEIKLESSAAFLFVYKNQFGRDPLKDVFNMAEAMNNISKEQAKEAKKAKTKEGEEKNYLAFAKKLDLPMLYDLTWALAKCGALASQQDIKEPLDFYIEHGDFKVLDHVDVVLELAIGSLTSDVEIQREDEVKKKK